MKKIILFVFLTGLLFSQESTKKVKYGLDQILSYNTLLQKEKKYDEAVIFLSNKIKKNPQNWFLKSALANLYLKLKKFNKSFEIRKNMLYRDGSSSLNFSNYLSYLELEIILSKKRDEKAYQHYANKLSALREWSIDKKILFDMYDNLYRVTQNQATNYKILNISTKVSQEIISSWNFEDTKEWIENQSPIQQNKLNAVLQYYKNIVSIKRGKIVTKRGVELAIGSEKNREYPKEKMISSIVGYTGIDKKTKRMAGKIGLEKYYNNSLDNNIDITLNIDFELQKKIVELFNGKSGVSIVMKTNGDVLSAVSYPSYDPNLFVQGISRKDWRNIINNFDYPFMNKIVSNLYLANSSLKIEMNVNDVINKFSDINFSRKTGIDLPHERVSVIPTPIQLAQYTATLATGKSPIPHVVHKIGKNIVRSKYEEVLDVNLTFLKKIRKNMYEVVQHHDSFNALSSLEIAGVSANIKVMDIPQNRKNKMTEKEKEHYLLAHKVMLSYAPYSRPEPKYVVVTFVEHDEGKNSAVEITAEIYKWMQEHQYFIQIKDNTLNEKREYLIQTQYKECYDVNIKLDKNFLIDHYKIYSKQMLDSSIMEVNIADINYDLHCCFLNDKLKKIHSITRTLEIKQKIACDKCRYRLGLYEGIRKNFKEECHVCLESPFVKTTNRLMYSYVLSDEGNYTEDVNFLTNVLKYEKNSRLLKEKLAESYTHLKNYKKAYELRDKLLHTILFNKYGMLVGHNNYISYMKLRLILDKPLDKIASENFNKRVNRGRTCYPIHLIYNKMIDNFYRVLNNQEVAFKIKKGIYKNDFSLEPLSEWIEKKPLEKREKLMVILKYYQSFILPHN